MQTYYAAAHYGSTVGIINNFFQKSSFTDVRIICKNNATVFCHKLILVSSSPFLKDIIKETNNSGEMVTICLPDFDRKLVRLLLTFLYEGVMKLKLEELKEFRELCNGLGMNFPGAEVMKIPTFSPQARILTTESAQRAYFEDAKGHVNATGEMPNNSDTHSIGESVVSRGNACEERSLESNGNIPCDVTPSGTYFQTVTHTDNCNSFNTQSQCSVSSSVAERCARVPEVPPSTSQQMGDVTPSGTYFQTVTHTDNRTRSSRQSQGSVESSVAKKCDLVAEVAPSTSQQMDWSATDLMNNGRTIASKREQLAQALGSLSNRSKRPEEAKLFAEVRKVSSSSTHHKISKGVDKHTRKSSHKVTSSQKKK